MTERRLMHLNGFMLYCAGPNTRLSWVYPEDKIRHQWYENAYWEEIAQTMERCGFDSFFLADNTGSYGQDEMAVRHGQHFPILDPVALVPRLAACTSHLGFVVTMSTTFYPPYLLARSLQTLDHVTDGRIGWNIITSVNPHEGANVGVDFPPHDERYDRAEEYVQLVKELWRSVEPDAMVMDHENRILSDVSKVHRIDFKGEWYRSAGPLSVMPGPQGTPVLAQAGSSDAGRSFAARHAELVFAPAGPNSQRRAFVDDLRSRASDLGRDPYSIKIVYTIGPNVAASAAEAKDRQSEILERPPHALNMATVSHSAGVNLSDYPPATRVSEILDQVTGMRGPFEDAAADDDPTLETFAARFQNLAADDRFVGTGEDIADVLDELLDFTDADGFQFSPTYYAPDCYRDIADHLIPELRNRGRIRSEYAGATLRANMKQSTPR